MKKLIGVMVLVVALIALSGCCSTRNAETGVSVDSYVAALEKVKSNLEDDLKPAMEELLDKDTAHIEPWKESKRNLLDDTITLCDDALQGDKAGRESDSESGDGTEGGDDDE